jgi:hypothetical protein
VTGRIQSALRAGERYTTGFCCDAVGRVGIQMLGAFLLFMMSGGEEVSIHAESSIQA